MSGTPSRKGRDDFTQEPEDGWLHDDDALAMGEGVFYSFPVIVRCWGCRLSPRPPPCSVCMCSCISFLYCFAVRLVSLYCCARLCSCALFCRSWPCRTRERERDDKKERDIVLCPASILARFSGRGANPDCIFSFSSVRLRQFLGSVEIKQSLSGLQLSLRTEAIRCV